MSSNLTIQDGGSLLTTGTSPTLDSIEVQRQGTTYSNIYNYWSSPVITTFADVWDFNGSHNDQDLYRFINGTTWNRIANTGGSMQEGVGYAMTGDTINSGGLLSFTGVPNNSDVQVTLTFNDDGGSNSNTDNDWNLVGNPYPSAIDIQSFLDDTMTNNIAGTLYFWDLDFTDSATSADYATRTYNTWVKSRYGSNPTGNTIASCQGFFVRAKSSGSVTFKNSYRVTGGNTQFFKSGDDYQRIWVEAYTNDRKDWNHLAIVFGDDCTDGYDNLHDGMKLKGNPNIAFYSKLNGDDYAIQALAPLNGQSKSVPLGLDAGKAGTYTIAIDSIDGIDASVGIYLHDVTTGNYHDLRKSDFTVSVNQDNTTLTQYELVFNATPTGIEALGEESWFHAFTQGDQLFVRSHGALQLQQARLIDLQGRVVWQGVTNSPEIRIATTDFANGIYLLEVQSESGVQTQKVFIP